MDRLAALRAFCAVVEHNSFSKAAAELNISVAKASKLVQDLEHGLKTNLLRRTTRRITLTEAGERYYRSMAPLLAEMASVDARIEQMTTTITGTLRMTMPLDFGRRLFMPLLSEFSRLYPELALDMELSDRQTDLVAEGFDLALRIADLKDSNLIAKPLGSFKMMCAASPHYLSQNTAIDKPADLAAHPCLTYSLIPQPNVWTLQSSENTVKVRVNSVLQLNSGDLLANAASQHLGVLYQPEFILAPYVESGALTPILNHWQQRTIKVWLVYPARQYLPMKVQAMIQFMEERLLHQ